MRHIHFYVLSVAVLLTAGLVVVLGGEESVESESQVLATRAIEPIETTTTILDLVIAPGDGKEWVLSKVEVALTEEASAHSSTTTSSTSTTTAPPKKSSTGGGSNTTPTTSPPTTSPPTTSPPSTSTAGYNSAYEAEFRSLVNSYRSANGLAALSSNGDLNSRARWWAKSMAESGKLAHSNISSLLPPWMAAGENVGAGGSVSGVFSLLKGSGPHREVMLGDFTHLGVGVWVDNGGTLWTAHVFTR